VSRCLLALVLVLLLSMSSRAQAHPLAPLVLQLTEHAGGLVDVSIKRAVVQPRGALPTPSLPCAREGLAEIQQLDDARVERFQLRCDRSLEGTVIGVGGLGTTEAIVRVELASGDVQRALLNAERSRWTIPDKPEPWASAQSYFVLGVGHLLEGLDHLVFVLGLLLLVPRRRDVVVAVSAFTIGHSITLAAAVLGFVALPAAWVEVAIALSLLALATQLLATEPRPRRAWVAAVGFGLLHGFGFAGGLVDAGLPLSDVPLALVSFNLGIEAAQLAVVVTVWLAAGVAKPLFFASDRWRRQVPAYAVGSLAAMWLIERSVAILVA